MLNTTHTLVALAMARGGLDRWAPYATATAVIASNLPDIDIVTQFYGTAVYLDFHRGLTHSIIGIPVLSIVLAAVMTLVRGRASAPGSTRRHFFSRHFAVALIVMATHPILDWTNTYGVRPFQPFNEKWFYGDLLFVFDPYLDLILLAGVIASYHVVQRRTFVARAGIAAALLYVGGMFGLRAMAWRQFQGYIRNEAVVLATVGPEFLTPFEWRGLAETPANVSSVRIDVRTGEIRPEKTIRKAEESAVTRAAETAYAAAVFRRFARFPVSVVTNTESGYSVLFIDLRFFQPEVGTALSAEVLLDSNLRIVRESMSFVRPVDAGIER